ncbi:hypothetical protein LIER_33297 [Lithospermum erythrorhizon]|uniref:XS domain-containing protein n=1 Tax=Lithospermum erythrorhizon TaxID=34254 RepID=A0AAV3RX77_LITER
MNPCVSDKEIVWPPMVMIMNTRYQQEENGKWIGMGNQELLDYFSPYEPLKARHSYGPQGHRGMSVLMFESSVVGYHNADRLSKDFKESGKGKDAWDRVHFAFLPGGKRQLFGFIAERKDLESFNQHCQGKALLKFDMRLYQEVVVKKMRQMSEENQDLMFFKNKAAKEKMHSKALEESFGIPSEHLKKTLEDSKIVRQKTKMHNEQIKEEMDYQEKFFNDQLKIIHEGRVVLEENIEKQQQEERNNVEQSPLKDDEVQKLINCQEERIEEFIVEKETLIKSFEARRLELRRGYWEEEIALEKCWIC